MSRLKRLWPANDNRPRTIILCGLSAELPVTAAEIELIEVFLGGLAERITAGEAAGAANENAGHPAGDDGGDQ